MARNEKFKAYSNSLTMLLNDIRIFFQTYQNLFKPIPPWAWIRTYQDHPNFCSLLRKFLYSNETFLQFTTDDFIETLSTSNIEKEFQDYLLDNTKFYYSIIQSTSTNTSTVVECHASQNFLEEYEEFSDLMVLPIQPVRLIPSNPAPTAQALATVCEHKIVERNLVLYYSNIPTYRRSFVKHSVGQMVTSQVYKTIRGRSFKVVIYAPHRSGLTTFIKNSDSYYFHLPISFYPVLSKNSIADASEQLNWTKHPEILMTPFPQMLSYGLCSIAILPSKRIYDYRISNGAVFQHMAYERAKDIIRGCDLVVYSDEYISDLFPPICGPSQL